MARHGFGIVGCGMIAEYHARAIAELPDARLVAVLDTSAGQDKGQRIAGLATGPCAIEHELASLLANPEIDIVCICTPSGAHLDPAVAAARAGKHVVVEKPMSLTLKDAEMMVEAGEKAGRHLIVGHSHGFDPPALHAARLMPSFPPVSNTRFAFAPSVLLGSAQPTSSSSKRLSPGGSVGLPWETPTSNGGEPRSITIPAAGAAPGPWMAAVRS